LPPVVPAVRKWHDASHKGCPGALAASFLWRFQAKWTSVRMKKTRQNQTGTAPVLI
jgi:hypothetical protein